MSSTSTSSPLQRAVRRMRRVPAARRIGVPVVVQYRRMKASGHGRPLLINSIPKAGTHLLSSMVNHLPETSFSGRLFQQDLYARDLRHAEGEVVSYDATRLRRDLARIASGTYAFAHLYYDDETAEVLRDLRVNTLFTVRDPRDVCVSLVRYVETYEAHPAHAALTRFRTFEDRLMAVITGFDDTAGGRGMTDVGRRMAPYLPWLDESETFRYEDFVGAPADVRRTQMDRLLVLLDYPADEAHRSMLSQGIGDGWSATLHTGRTGGWRESFTSDHVAAFNEYASDALVRLGYEH